MWRRPVWISYFIWWIFVWSLKRCVFFSQHIFFLSFFVSVLFSNSIFIVVTSIVSRVQHDNYISRIIAHFWTIFKCNNWFNQMLFLSSNWRRFKFFIYLFRLKWPHADCPFCFEYEIVLNEMNAFQINSNISFKCMQLFFRYSAPIDIWTRI